MNTDKLMRRDWRWRFLLAFLPLSIMALVGSALLWRDEHEQTLRYQGQLLQSRLQLADRATRSALINAATDLMLQANNPELVRLVGLPEPQWQQHGEYLLSFLTYKPIYEKIRMLDLEGRERVRINLNRGSPVQVGNDHLQDLHETTYFRGSVGLARGQIYLSRLNLNTENGRIEMPPKPTLRLATPFFDQHGEKRGVLVINLLIEPMAQHLAGLVNAKHDELWLLDETSQWLLGGSEQDRFSRILGRGHTLAQREPGLWRQLGASEQGVVRHGEDLVIFRQLAPDNPGAPPHLRQPFVSDAPQRWWLVLHKRGVSLNTVSSDRQAIVYAIGSLVVAVLLAALYASLTLRVQSRRESEHLLFRLFDAAPQAVMLVDADGELVHANPAWYQLTGLSDTAAAGQGWWCVLGEEDRQAVHGELAKVLAGEMVRHELSIHAVDGRARWVVCQITRGPGWQGSQRRLVINLIDIQAQKEHALRQASLLELVQGVLDGCSEPILVLDRQQVLMLSNPACAEVFGALFGQAPAAGQSLAQWLVGRPDDLAELYPHFSRALLGSASSHVRLQLGDTRRVFIASFSPLRDGEGQLAGAILFARDVTEFARLQAAVARSEELFRGVFAASLDAVFVLEAERDEQGQIIDFRYLEVGGQPIAQLGLQREHFIGKRLGEVSPQDSFRANYLEHFRQVVESGQPMLEERYMQGEGMVSGWYEIRAINLGWGVVVACRDIGERKQVEMALAASEAMQRNVLDSAPYAIISTEDNGRIAIFNRAAEQLLGYRAEELIGRHTVALFHDPAELVRFAAELSEQHGQVLEADGRLFDLAARERPLVRDWTYIHRDGTRIPVRLTVSHRTSSDGRRLGSMGIAFDLRERLALEAERDRLFAVVDSLPDMVRLSALDGQVLYINREGRRWMGLAPDAPLDGLHISDGYTDWAYQLISKVAIPQALAGEVWQGETQWQRADGSLIDAHQMVLAPKMGATVQAFTATVVHDVTELRAMERKMIEDDAMLNSILESVHDAIVVVDEAGQVQSLNPAVADIFGYRLHHVMGHAFTMLLPEGDKQFAADDFHRYVQTGQQGHRVVGERQEAFGRRADGTVFPMELTVSEIWFGNKRLFTSVMRDISERKAFEAQLIANIDEMQAAQTALNAANQQLLGANLELARMAQQDGLTGVANRRAFDQQLASEWGRAAREGASLALLMVDVDHFKKFNDGYGHQLGDECLRQIAAVLRGAISRTSDFVARYGGEEFALILPGTDAHGACEVAAHIRRDLAAAAIPHAFSPTAAHVTASIGVAALVPLHGVAADYLVSAADQALYRAKDRGRDQAALAGD